MRPCLNAPGAPATGRGTDIGRRASGGQRETCEVGSLRRHCPDQVVEVAFRSPRPSGLSARPSTRRSGEPKSSVLSASPVELPRSPRRLIFRLLLTPLGDSSLFETF